MPSSYSILPDLQTVFGHLQESKLQYYTPDTFWKNFKLYGQPINVREQRDALEFFNDLIDQVDEILKVFFAKNEIGGLHTCTDTHTYVALSQTIDTTCVCFLKTAYFSPYMQNGDASFKVN